MSLLITSHNQLALTSCVAKMSFLETCFFLSSDKSLTVALECKLVLWNSLVLVEVIFCFWHSSLSISAGLACTLSGGKDCLKAEDCGGRERSGSNASLRAPLPPPFPVRLCMPLFEEEGREGFPLPQPSLWIPQSQWRLVVRASRCRGERATLQSLIQAEERICCGLSLVHSMVWSQFHSFLCRGASD